MNDQLSLCSSSHYVNWMSLKNKLLNTGKGDIFSLLLFHLPLFSLEKHWHFFLCSLVRQHLCYIFKAYQASLRFFLATESCTQFNLAFNPGYFFGQKKLHALTLPQISIPPNEDKLRIPEVFTVTSHYHRSDERVVVGTHRLLSDCLPIVLPCLGEIAPHRPN